jgi:hypothetical protein
MVSSDNNNISELKSEYGGQTNFEGAVSCRVSRVRRASIFQVESIRGNEFR